MNVLVVDAGTTSVRAALVRPDGSVGAEHRRPVTVSTPNPGFVEFDPAQLAAAALEVAGLACDEGGDVQAVGIASQRASTIVWDRASGEPVGPGIGWQDLRTAAMCLTLREQGVRLAPNASATKLAVLLDMADPDRSRDLCFGTVDAWLAWTLSGGALHVTDATNAGVTGLMTGDGSGWDPAVLDALRIPASVLPRIVDSSGILGPA
ncbi:MAG: FGGY family carbohydrate kinase, partial [Actinomycetota bacterium]